MRTRDKKAGTGRSPKLLNTHTHTSHISAVSARHEAWKTAQVMLHLAGAACV